MKRIQLGLLTLLAVGLWALTADSQPPGGKGKGKGGKKGPPPFQVGKVLPPYIRDGLDLSEDQEKQLADLEKEVRQRLLKILTAEQKEKLAELKDERKDRVRDRLAHRLANARELNLTEEQKAQIQEVRKEYRPKVHEAGNKFRAAVQNEVTQVLAVIKG